MHSMSVKSSQKKKNNRDVKDKILPIASMESVYKEFVAAFEDTQVSDVEHELIQTINKVLEKLDLGDPNIKETEKNKTSRFLTWTADMLISAREKLARFSEPLGEYISYHESRSDFAYIWRKGAYATDWLPIKTKLGNTMVRVTNVEVDSELTKKYIGEQYYSMFHRRRADYLIRKLEAMDRMIRTLDHRLHELGRQFRLPQEQNVKQ